MREQENEFKNLIRYMTDIPTYQSDFFRQQAAHRPKPANSFKTDYTPAHYEPEPVHDTHYYNDPEPEIHEAPPTSSVYVSRN